MQAVIKELNTPLFEGIAPDDRIGMLGCTGYHLASFSKGEIVAFENENINHVGIVAHKTEDGAYMIVHCSSRENGVVITEAWESGFRYFRRPVLYGENGVKE